MTLKSMFEKFGQEVTLRGNDGWSTPIFGGFIQPLRYKNKMYLNGVNTVIGFNSQGHYLYIGPPDPDLTLTEDNAFLFSDGSKYQIDRAERVYNGDRVFYIWAIIRTIVEAE